MGKRKWKSLPVEWPSQVGHNEFIELVRNHLPEVYSRMEELKVLGLLHVEMGIIRSMALEAYNERINNVWHYFEFVHEVNQRASTPEILDAVRVSFLIDFILGVAKRPETQSWLPDDLRAAFDTYVAEYERYVEAGMFRWVYE